AKLRAAVQTFIAEKNWEGCRGQAITDEVKVTIAGQACLLVLGFEDYHFDTVETILVYPGGFLAHGPNEHDDRVVQLLGQSVPRGAVLLSWWDASWGGRRLGNANLVLHEFAHKLAEVSAPESGLPMHGDPRRQQHWRKVLKAEYKRLREDAD